MGKLTNKQFKARLAEVTANELTQPELWHYVSFADKKFNGVVVIKGHGVTDCVSKCHRLGINPGGQVIAIPYPGDMVLPLPRDRNRLLSKADVLRIWPDAKSIREHEGEHGKS